MLKYAFSRLSNIIKGRQIAGRTIVIFDQYPFIGGGQVVLLSVVEVALKVADRVVLVIPKKGGLESAVHQRFGRQVEVIDTVQLRLTNGRKGLLDIFRIAGYTSRFVFSYWHLIRRADLIYANGARQFAGLMLLSILLQRKCFYHIHLDHSYIEKWLILLAANLPTTQGIVVNSSFVMQEIVDVFPSLAKNNRMVLVENALDSVYDNRKFEDRFTARSDLLQVVILGEIRQEKGQDCAIELARRNNRIQVHLVGRIGDDHEQWARQLKEDAPCNVIFHEPVTDVPVMFDNLGIHVNLIPSRIKEAFGLVAIEGMACSCITIVREIGGLTDIALKTGAILCRNTDEMAAALDKLLAMTPVNQLHLANKQYHAAMVNYRSGRFMTNIEKLFINAR